MDLRGSCGRARRPVPHLFRVVAHGGEAMAQVLAQFLALRLDLGLAARKVEQDLVGNGVVLGCTAVVFVRVGRVILRFGWIRKWFIRLLAKIFS